MSMTDRERARLRGPVRSVRSDHAELDARTNDWGPFRQGQTLVYDVEGRLTTSEGTGSRKSRRSATHPIVISTGQPSSGG
ncbi:MAG TPA: hypothetical protein VFV95_13265 [Vicinamibacterales bacterium]|nr:hypothetical protein [Vicinamibacterales bacterium]